MNEIWTAIGTVVVTLFGVWRMLAHYETRNDAAHAELGHRIEKVQSDLGQRIDALSVRIDGVSPALAARIDKVYELLSNRGTS